MGKIIGVHYRTGRLVRIEFDNGYISSVEDLGISSDDLPMVAPGLVDLQVNGYRGHDVNEVSVFSKETILQLTEALWEEGVTTFLPTVVTNSDDAIEEILCAVAGACGQWELVARCIAGIHLEGPFISPEDGPRGAHPREKVKPPDWELFERWQRAAAGRIRIVTLSPEWPQATDFIRRCCAAGVIAAIGHTAASPQQIREAVAAGARMSTHLGNGAHVLLPRHPNYIWEQLADDRLWASVIADGHHLPESVLKVFLRAKGNKLVLVSDMVAFCGMEPGEYVSHIGGRVVLSADRRLYMADNPNLLAGSVQPLKDAIHFLTQKHLCEFGDAWDMASTRPSTLLGLPIKNGLSPGAPADLVLFDYTSDRGVQVVQTIKDGKCVYSR